MSITTVDNYLIHYEVLGRGQPLIFIHGWLGSWRYWWPTMQGLSSRHRAFAFDLWGFGDSSKAEDRYSLSAYMMMLDQFIDKLGIAKPVTLVGHSLGAAVALKYTLQSPESVDRVVTVALPIQGELISERLLTSTPDDVIARELKSNSFNEVDTEIRKTDQQAMNRLAQEMAQENYADVMANLPRPVLVVFGNEDSVVRPPTGDYYHLQKSGNNRYYVAIDNCNHFPMLQETAKFNRLLMDFFHMSDEDLPELTLKEYWQRRTH